MSITIEIPPVSSRLIITAVVVLVNLLEVQRNTRCLREFDKNTPHSQQEGFFASRKLRLSYPKKDIKDDRKMKLHIMNLLQDREKIFLKSFFFLE